jgi:hypothetical protein
MLHIESGHSVTKDVQQVPGKFVRFVDEKNRTAFEVTVGVDGKSIEVRAVDAFIVDDTLYDKRLCVYPEAANAVNISVRLFPNT